MEIWPDKSTGGTEPVCYCRNNRTEYCLAGESHLAMADDPALFSCYYSLCPEVSLFLPEDIDNLKGYK